MLFSKLFRIARVALFLILYVILFGVKSPQIVKAYHQDLDRPEELCIQQAYKKVVNIQIQEALRYTKQYPDEPGTYQKPLFHSFIVFFDRDQNKAQVTEIMSVINTAYNHGIFLTIPETFYLKDKEIFHVTKIDNVKVKYWEVYHPEEIFTDLLIDENIYSKYKEKVIILKAGDPNKYAPGPYLYLISYDIINITENTVCKNKNYQVIHYNLTGGASDFVYEKNNFIIFYPQRTLQEHLYYVDKDRNTKEISKNLESLSSFEIPNIKVKEFSIDFLPKNAVLSFFVTYKPGTFHDTPAVAALKLKGKEMSELMHKIY